VRGSGTRGEPPPPTLKVAMNLEGGFRNSMRFRLAGLDLDDKANLVEELVAQASGGRDRFDEWHVARTPLPPSDPAWGPADNDAATQYLTVTVKSRDKALVGKLWSSRLVGLSLSSVPGHSIAHPPEDATPFLVYWPTLVDAARVAHTVTLDGETSTIAPSPSTSQRAPLAPPAPPPPSTSATMRRPLGRVFGTRSGDKGGNANLGIWGRTPAAYAWLHHVLTVEKLRELFPDLAPFAIERALLPNLHAVNFTIRGLLGEGVAASTRSDPQAKTLGEYVRARLVELPSTLVT
jgi:hypothetical protein